MSRLKMTHFQQHDFVDENADLFGISAKKVFLVPPSFNNPEAFFYYWNIPIANTWQTITDEGLGGGQSAQI